MMRPEHTVKVISPMLVVADMDVTIRFYTEVLGFEVRMRSDGYSILGRDGHTIHLMPPDDPSVMEHVRGHSSIYIEVEDIESLWSHVRQYQGKYAIRDLFDRDYGMREFHIADPNECLVFVGEAIKKT